MVASPLRTIFRGALSFQGSLRVIAESTIITLREHKIFRQDSRNCQRVSKDLVGFEFLKVRGEEPGAGNREAGQDACLGVKTIRRRAQFARSCRREGQSGLVSVSLPGHLDAPEMGLTLVEASNAETRRSCLFLKPPGQCATLHDLAIRRHSAQRRRDPADELPVLHQAEVRNINGEHAFEGQVVQGRQEFTTG